LRASVELVELKRGFVNGFSPAGQITVPATVFATFGPSPRGVRRLAIQGAPLTRPPGACIVLAPRPRGAAARTMIETLTDLLHRIYDVEGIIRWGGMLMLVAIVFAETGLLVGFFLPGDSLLVTAGVFAAAQLLDIRLLLTVVSVAAVVGDQVGYYIGYRTGPRIFRREDSLFFKQRHLIRARDFYERHGGKTIILARFMPIVRTFAPVVAGVAEMEYRRFVTFNVVGGVLWVWSMSLLGYFLGRSIPDVDEHIHVVIVVVVFLSILPGIIEYLRSRSRAAEPEA
jgi:membrane-associated protein